ncbi:MAG TPA: flagellar hook protein FlgE [Actinomycetota bacterium]|nr:flagellar hook protein FlgE [Actinomycetota bacterium]
MFTAVSSLRAHQMMMDVVGNNIGNVNTAGYKASQVTFQEALTQVLRGPAGGINPLQVGLGVKVATIDPVFSQGATQVTGRFTDVAIQGDGFFVVQKGGERLYTRAGSFSVDAEGNLVGFDGYRVLGWAADASGAIDTNGPIRPITIPIGQVKAPRATTVVEVGGNLSADAPVGTEVTTSIAVYDSLGNTHEVVFTFEKTADNQWSVRASIDGTDYTLTPSTLSFGPDGTLTSTSPLVFSGYTPPGAEPLTFDVVLQGDAPLVQYGGTTTAEARSQDGRGAGVLRGFAISSDGTITGQFSNGETKVLGALAIASFSNPAGLVRVGNSNFASSLNSGEPLVGLPGTGSRGTLTAGALEMSNVDLAQEFTNLILAQRGFQANSRVISASDELLLDLVNLKR